jgi:hypothetical protein
MLQKIFKKRVVLPITLLVILLALVAYHFLTWGNRITARYDTVIQVFFYQDNAGNATTTFAQDWLLYSYEGWFITDDEGRQVLNYDGLLRLADTDPMLSWDHPEIRRQLGFSDTSGISQIRIFHPQSEREFKDWLADASNSFQDGDVRILLNHINSGALLYGVTIPTLWDQLIAGRPTFRAYLEYHLLGKANRSVWSGGMADAAFSILLRQKTVQIYDTKEGWLDFYTAEEAEFFAYTIVLSAVIEPETLGVFYQSTATNPEAPFARHATRSFDDDVALIEIARNRRELDLGSAAEGLRQRFRAERVW